MKRLLAIACLVAASGTAVAADLPPLKAAPFLSTTYPVTGAGVYAGLWMAGATQRVEGVGIPGVNAAGLNQVGGSIGALVGYSWANANGSRFIRLEADIGWQNLNGQAQGLSMNGPLTAQVAAQAGVPLDQIAAFFPNLGLPSLPGIPVLPAGVTASPGKGYVGLGADFEDVSINFGAASNTVWSIAPLLQVGMLTPLSNGSAIDARAEIVFQGNGTCIGAVCANLGNLYRAKIGYAF